MTDYFKEYHLLRRMLKKAGIDGHRLEDIEKNLKNLQYKANRKVQTDQLQIKDLQDYLTSQRWTPPPGEEHFDLVWLRDSGATEIIVITDNIIHAIEKIKPHIYPAGRLSREEHILKRYYYRIYEDAMLWHHDDKPYSIPVYYYHNYGTEKYRKGYMYDNIRRGNA